LSQRETSQEFQDLLIAKFASLEDRPNIVRHNVSRESIKSLVSADFGIGLSLEASTSAIFSGLVYRELRDDTEPSRIGYSAYWRADNDNPALTNFLNLFSARYPSLAT
jgi:DNA-binding transcriptional LysR family regulator